MNTYQILRYHAINNPSLRVWGLVQDAISLSRITWSELFILTNILRTAGQFNIPLISPTPGLLTKPNLT